MSIASWLRSLTRSRRRVYHLNRREPRRLLVRRRLFECLEGRQLLASDWHNAFVSTDINNDRSISPLDALLVINKLNVNHGAPLPPLASGVQPSAYFDTSGDGVLSALDALLVINSLNAPTNQLTDIHALSNHYVMATFNTSATDVLMFPENFHLTGPSAQRLDVLSVVKGNAPNQLILTTADQAGLNYSTTFASAAKVSMPSAMSLAGLVSGTYYGPADNVTPRLVDIVPTSKTSVLATYDRAMSASAIDPANYSIVGEDGQLVEVLSAQFASGESVVELQTAPQSNSNYTVNIQKVSAIGSQAVTSLAVVFHGIGSRPTLVAVTSNWSEASDGSHTSTVLMTFSEALSDEALKLSAYTITNVANKNALNVRDIKFLDDQRRLVELTTAEQFGALFTVEKITATDPDGNTVVVPGNPAINQFRGSAIPTLRNASPIDATHLYLTFGGPINDSALSKLSYKLEKLDSSGNSSSVIVLAQDATFAGSQRTVVSLTTPSVDFGKYRISTTNSFYAGSIPIASVEFQSYGSQPSTPPVVVGASSTSPMTVLLSFNVGMSNDLLQPSNYLIRRSDGTRLTISSAKFVGTEQKTVELTTLPQLGIDYQIISINAKDINNNPVSLTDSVSSFRGVAAPLLRSAAATDATHVYLTMAGLVGDSALSPSSFTIETLDDQGNSSGNLAISSSEFVGNQPNFIALTTSIQSATKYRISTTAGLTDRLGVAVPASSLNFQGVANQARLVTISSTSSSTVLVTFSMPMSEDALSPSLYNIVDNADDTRLSIFDARFVGTEHRLVELTTGPQTGLKYKVKSISATDTGGGTAIVIPKSDINTFDGPVIHGGSSVPDAAPPRVVGAASLSNTTVLVAFSEPMSASVLNKNNYFIVQQNVNSEAGYVSITNVAFVEDEDDNRSVLLTTSSQNELTYSVTAVNVTDLGGTTLASSAAAGQRDPTKALFPGTPSQSHDTITTRVVSTEDRNADGKIGFGDLITDDHGFKYVIRDRNGDKKLTLDFADNIKDVNENQQIDVGDKLRIDAGFGIDADGDGLTDNVESRGWTVIVSLLDGSKSTRQVTSDPYNADTDGDGLTDTEELRLGIDPRSADTDGDQLTDYAEFNEIYSNPNSQDSDSDSLDDYAEFQFFKTSPYLADSDGDQLRDDYEIFANRNPRVSDLPRPEITVGQIKLQLDVRFEETQNEQRRDLETKSVSATLSRSVNAVNTNSHTGTVEGHIEGGFGDGNSATGWKNPFLRIGASAGGTWVQNGGSETLTQQAYENSLNTDHEVTDGFNVVRHVEGAVMQVAIDLRNLSSLAYRVKNLQVTAFMQDPQDHSRLTPIATLLPDSEPAEGFTLGPLVQSRGPFIFSNTSIIPSLVESFMANPSGLIFRISNYDIIDESGRNFAFTSQEIVERTSMLIVDYGGASSLRAALGGQAFDELKSGDETEIHHVATSAGQVIDTNSDGVIDKNDRRAAFDANGKEVGVTLFDAFTAIGLTHYDESADPSASLSTDQLLGSFSTDTEYFRGVGGATVPSATNLKNNSVKFTTDPDLATGTLVRVAKAGGGLVEGRNYFVRNDSGSYSFYDSKEGASTPATPISLKSEIKVGIFIPTFTNATDTVANTVTFDPSFDTGSKVDVAITTGGKLTAKSYFIRNLSGGNYSLFDTKANATNDSPFFGRIELTGSTVSSVKLDEITHPPLSTDPQNQVVSFDPKFDPRFETGTSVNVTITKGKETTVEPYFIRKLSGNSYSFYDTQANASQIPGVVGIIDLNDSIVSSVKSDQIPYFPISSDLVNKSVLFTPNSDPLLLTGMRVGVNIKRGEVTSNENYFIRNLSGGRYSFYDTQANAKNLSDVQGRIDFAGSTILSVKSNEIAYNPASINLVNKSVSLNPESGYTTGTRVDVTITMDGKTTIRPYFIRKLSTGNYSFYDSQANAIHDSAFFGRIELIGSIVSSVKSNEITYNPVSMDLVNKSVSFDPKFATGSTINITSDSADLIANKEYFIRKIGGSSYSFYSTAADARGATNPIDLTSTVNTGIFSTTARGTDKIVRIRGLANDTINDKHWEIMTAFGIDNETDVSKLILKSGTAISLNYVQDLDGDGLSADVENFLGTSDSPLPVGANVPNSTNILNDSVSFNTDPDLDNGTLVRVSDNGGGLSKEQNYFVRNLGGGAYSFYDTKPHAKDTLKTSGIKNITAPITAGMYVPSIAVTTNKNNYSISFDPGFDKGVGKVEVTSTGGGLSIGSQYFVRNSGGNYSFYITQQDATADINRIPLTDYIVTGIKNVGAEKAYNPFSTDFVNQTVSFDPNYATGTVIKTTDTSGQLIKGTEYFLRNDLKGNYSFFKNFADAIANTNVIPLAVDLSAGLYSSTAKGRDTDHDGLDDRFEALIGWTVSTSQQTYQVYSSPNRRDSNFDNPKLGADSHYDGSDLFAAPAAWNDKKVDTDGDGIIDAGNGLRDRFEVSQLDKDDWVLDPIRKDTDEDGIDDATELSGFKIKKIGTNELSGPYRTNPLTPFTDSDTFTDGFEKSAGLDPTNGNDTDQDGDGLPDLVETTGWSVGRKVLTPELQEIKTSAIYSLQYGGGPSTIANTTAQLRSDATASEVEKAINDLKAVKDQGGTVVVRQSSSSTFVINFGGTFLGVNQVPLKVSVYIPLPFGLSVLNLNSSGPATTIQDGADFGVEAVSSNGYVAGSLSSATVQSSVNKVDSDNDGLTDYEEFFLHTNPVSKDSDEDGIDDFTEHFGYSLGHQVGGKELGIIKTDPLDADTDNDKRSDGAEAELKDIEQKRWIVRVDGKAPIRVFSNPLEADADFDGLVDGDEFRFDTTFPDRHTDPNNGNTDGDARDDGKEFTAHTNPLIEDFQVTVYYSSIHITNGGDGSGNPGDFGFDLGIRRPDNSQPGGLSSNFTSIVQSNVTLSAPFHSKLNRDSLSELEDALPVCGTNKDDGLCNNGTAIESGNNNFGIPLNNNDTLQFRSLLTDEKRSFSFGMTKSQFFSLEGVIVQDDASKADEVKDKRVYLGGLEGLLANDSAVGGQKFRPVFYGFDLIANASRFHDVTFNFTTDDEQSGTGSEIAGSVTVLFVIS